jgi:hypothetical protein
MCEEMEQVTVREFDGDFKSEGMKYTVGEMLLVDRFSFNVSKNLTVFYFLKKLVKGLKSQ